MDAEDITRRIGIPHLTLENFELADPDTRYILTSPRSLQACERCGIRPVELLRTPVEEFYDRYKDRDYLTRSDILDEFRLQEKVRLAKLSQSREERQRIIYLETEVEASRIPCYLEEKGSYSNSNISREMTKSPTSKNPKNVKRIAWDSSTRGADIPLRSEVTPDVISPSPVESQKSWVESLRSPDLARKATSTPIRDVVSPEDLLVIGSKSAVKERKKPAERSKSVPRTTTRRRSETNLLSKSETRLGSSELSRRSETRLGSSELSRRSETRLGSSELSRSYDKLQGAHMQLTANVSQLEQELKALKLQQRRDEALQKKKASIEALKLQKQSTAAASRTRHARRKVDQMRRLEEGRSAYELRQLHNMESHSRAHLLRETQAHINELTTEIKQYKTQRSARLIKEDRASWEDLVTKRQARALQRADVKVRRHTRDVSAKARHIRLERERQQSQNMRQIIEREEHNLLRNLDNIISKEKKAEYLLSEKQRMLRKCRDPSRRAKTRNSKSFDKMSQEAELMAHLESRGTASRWK